MKRSANIDHPTAIGASKTAADTAGLDAVFDSMFGPADYVVSVNSDAEEFDPTYCGWLYRVNWVQPNFGAAAYTLADGDEVLWYWGAYTAPPLKVSADKTTLTTAESFTTLVDAFDGAAWSPLPVTTVRVGAQQFTTDADGEVKHISLTAGSYTVSAEKDTAVEYTRSNRVIVGVIADISVNAPANVAEDSDFTVALEIDQVNDLDAADYKVSFDNLVLRLDNVTSGSINGTAIPVGTWNLVTPGTATIVQNLEGLNGVSGAGQLAVRHFHIIGYNGDSSNITLSEVKLSNTLARQMPSATTGDTVQVLLLPGDANGDGNLNALDVTSVERIIAGLDVVTPGADANQDGSIDALDITKTERLIVGLD